MLTDIQIAQAAHMQPVSEIAAKLGIKEDELEHYGKYKAKLSEDLWERVKDRPDGKLILVTAVNPTPAGEGKTTTTVGLGQAMAKLGYSSVICLREPSLGPVFGVKGGAAGGGYAQVVPMEDINLHFTGDMHAIGAANNLLCAMVDNHLQQGNELGLDPRTIVIRRAMDMNDRALRYTMVGLGGRTNGVPREDGFMITVASEVMAILCLAADLNDLKERLGRILVGYTYEKKALYARDFGAQGAMAALLKDAINPNLVQTLENTPCIMHGGPFANIAHGCNSIRATRLGLKLADYCVTEAGFGADLGAEKFFDIKCRMAGFRPSCAVLVATVRALKYNGGVPVAELKAENVDALKAGCENLKKHIENLAKYGIPVVVAINRFDTDTEAELETVREVCRACGVRVELSEGFARGGEGVVDLARVVAELSEGESGFHTLYDDDMTIRAKIGKIAKEIYGAAEVKYSAEARREINSFEKMGYGMLPVCIAKTQYSLSDNPKLLGRPEGFALNVADVRLSSGAGFIVARTGEIMTMPGLPKHPAAEKIDINENGQIEGLF